MPVAGAYDTRLPPLAMIFVPGCLPLMALAFIVSAHAIDGDLECQNSPTLALNSLPSKRLNRYTTFCLLGRAVTTHIYTNDCGADLMPQSIKLYGSSYVMISPSK